MVWAFCQWMKSSRFSLLSKSSTDSASGSFFSSGNWNSKAKQYSIDSSDVNKEDSSTFRGDPLKGLNLGDETKTLKIGDYYALIIGIDNYSGSWKKLKNAGVPEDKINQTLKALEKPSIDSSKK